MCSLKHDCWCDLLGLFIYQRLCRTLCTLTPDKLSAVSYDPLTHFRHSAGDRSVKVKVLPYSLPSVGPGADPSVQAVSRQVGCHYFSPGLRFTFV